MEYCVPPSLVIRVCGKWAWEAADMFAPFNRPVIFMALSLGQVSPLFDPGMMSEAGGLLRTLVGRLYLQQ